MTQVFLGLGSNIDPRDNLREALRWLQEQWPGMRISPTYESEAVGFSGDNFLNLVVTMQVQQSLSELMQHLREIETRLGRVRGSERFSSRHIDIDILFYGQQVCQDPIVLPRAEILENAYVLLPLAELAPDWLHPISGKTMLEHWEAYPRNAQKLWRVEDICL
jgi:2-amino-4-hydroxy-6-hydroxymethyldihydropteridine diphosphokinase